MWCRAAACHCRLRSRSSRWQHLPPNGGFLRMLAPISPLRTCTQPANTSPRRPAWPAMSLPASWDPYSSLLGAGPLGWGAASAPYYALGAAGGTRRRLNGPPGGTAGGPGEERRMRSPHTVGTGGCAQRGGDSRLRGGGRQLQAHTLVTQQRAPPPAPPPSRLDALHPRGFHRARRPLHCARRHPGREAARDPRGRARRQRAALWAQPPRRQGGAAQRAAGARSCALVCTRRSCRRVRGGGRPAAEREMEDVVEEGTFLRAERVASFRWRPSACAVWGIGAPGQALARTVAQEQEPSHAGAGRSVGRAEGQLRGWGMF